MEDTFEMQLSRLLIVMVICTIIQWKMGRGRDRLKLSFTGKKSLLLYNLVCLKSVLLWSKEAVKLCHSGDEILMIFFGAKHWVWYRLIHYFTVICGLNFIKIPCLMSLILRLQTKTNNHFGYIQNILNNGSYFCHSLTQPQHK